MKRIEKTDIKRISPIRIKKLRGEKSKKIEKGIKEIEAVLVYSSFGDVPFFVEGKKVPLFVSMIPGPAHHYISKVDAPNIKFDDLLKNMFVLHDIAAYKKAFFIGNLTCKNYWVLYPHVTEKKDPKQKLYIEHFFLEVAIVPLTFHMMGSSFRITLRGGFKCQNNDRWYQINASTDIQEEDLKRFELLKKKISEMEIQYSFAEKKELLEKLNKVVEGTTPVKGALCGATGGTVGEKRVMKMINFYRETILRSKFPKVIKEIEMGM